MVSKNMYSNKLINLRENNDLTQNDLSKIIGINRVSISRWENGIEIIPIRKAVDIIKHFNTNLDYLFGLTKNNKPNKNYDIKKEISGKRIVLFRKEFNLTLRDLAKKLNTSSSTISSYETGKTLILSAFAYQMASKYKISMDWLLGLSDTMYIDKGK